MCVKSYIHSREIRTIKSEEWRRKKNVGLNEEEGGRNEKLNLFCASLGLARKLSSTLELCHSLLLNEREGKIRARKVILKDSNLPSIYNPSRSASLCKCKLILYRMNFYLFLSSSSSSLFSFV
jgi:hypothetical protein